MTDHVNRPLLGEPGAPCRMCGAPLAADQRYCLQCGTRRAEARLPFLEILKGQGPRSGGGLRATPLAAPPQHGGALGRVSANAVAIAGVACLVLALGVGVLIGGMNDNSAPAAAPAQIIRVGAAPTVVAPTTTAPAATTSATADDATPAARRPAARRRAAAESKATNSTVRDLGRSSGGDYAKRSARLPDTVGTGGRLPPKRAGTIGAGSDVESIG
ncbi:hypothetical protein [Conexibacter woesei]|uniref:hypothetical protein n=1 Tax=Conexibacter woesei TaxID=191495 RepID=UPI00041317F4|nr:hypothetical protein [Conexibacter woesei]